jgi:hypothetical protein
VGRVRAHHYTMGKPSGNEWPGQARQEDAAGVCVCTGTLGASSEGASGRAPPAPRCKHQRRLRQKVRLVGVLPPLQPPHMAFQSFRFQLNFSSFR